MSLPPQFEIKEDAGECTWRYLAPTHESNKDVRNRVLDACELLKRVYGGEWHGDAEPNATAPITSPIGGQEVGREYEWTLRRG